MKLTKEILKEICYLFNEDMGDYNYFIESGTYMGDTIEEIKTCFDSVKTIELGVDLNLQAIVRFKDDANVECIQGDTSHILKQLLPNEPCILFLDAHFSHCGTAQGDKDVPLLEEIDILVKHNEKMIIIIDDFRLFDTFLNEDWLGITTDKILSKFGDVKHKVYNDKLIILKK